MMTTLMNFSFQIGLAFERLRQVALASCEFEISRGESGLCSIWASLGASPSLLDICRDCQERALEWE